MSFSIFFIVKYSIFILLCLTPRSEAADVAVIAGVAAGAVTKGAGRVRPITVAEQRLAELAEQSIKEALHGSSTSVASTAGNQTPAARPTSAPAAASISQHFPPVPASAGSKHPSSAPTSAVAAEATSAHAPPQRSFAPARAAPAPAPAPARAAPAPAPAAAASAAHPEALSPASINSRPRSPAAEKVVLKRMLEKDELEVAGKALQLTVMHRYV